MKQKGKLRKNPGKKRRSEEKELNSALRGERIPSTRVVKDKRGKEREKRMKNEMREGF